MMGTDAEICPKHGSYNRHLRTRPRGGRTRRAALIRISPRNRTDLNAAAVQQWWPGTAGIAWTIAGRATPGANAISEGAGRRTQEPAPLHRDGVGHQPAIDRRVALAAADTSA